jgi:glucokinase
MKELKNLMGWRPDIKVVDCTLRDGGLVNDFFFTDEFVKQLYITNIKAGVCDGEGNLLNKLSIKTHAERTEEEIIHDMGKLALDVIKDLGKEVSDIEAIGIGSPGTPDNEEGLLVYSANLPFNNSPMRKLIRDIVDLPVYIDNDANCAAMAEAVAGAAKGTKDSVTITLGTGVGAGVIIGGRIYSGFNQAGSEFGHTVLVSGGRLC